MQAIVDVVEVCSLLEIVERISKRSLPGGKDFLSVQEVGLVAG